MSQPIKITESELAEINMLQKKFQELTLKLGTLGVEKMELDALVSAFVEKEKRLKEEWATLKKLDEGVMDKIVKTYGEGNLNMVDGTFTPAAPIPPKQ